MERGWVNEYQSLRFLFPSFILKRAKVAWAQTLALLSVIGLSVAVFIAVLYASNASVQSLEKAVGTFGTDLSFEIRDSRGDLALPEVRTIARDIANVSHLFPLLERQVLLTNQKREVSATLMGVDIFSLSEVGVKEIRREGKAPTRGLVLGPRIAKDLGVREGESLSVSVDDKSFTLPVAAVLRDDELSLSPTLCVVDLGLLSDLLGEAEQLTAVGVIAKDKAFIPELKSFVEEYLESKASHLVIQDASATRESSEKLLAAFRANILVLVGVALLVSAFTIFNASSIRMVKVQREVSILKTLGLSEGAVSLLLLSESIVIGALGATVGLTLGRPLSNYTATLFLGAARSLYSSGGSLDSLNLGTNVTLHLLALIVGIGTCVIGTWYPIQRVRKVPAALSSRMTFTEEESKRGNLWLAPLFITFSSLLLSLSWILLSSVIAYAAALFLFLTLLFVSPGVVSSGASYIIPKVKQFDVPGLLAAGFIGTAKRATGLSVGVTATGLSLLIGLGVLVTSFQYTLDNWVGHTFVADLFVRPRVTGTIERPAVLSEAMVEAIAHEPGVKEVYRFISLTREVQGELVSVAGADIEVAARHNVYALTEGSLPIGDDEVLVSESAARRLDLTVGETVELLGCPKKVRGIYSDYSRDRGLILLRLEVFRSLTGFRGLENLSVYLEDPERVGELNGKLKQKVGDGVLVTNNQELRKIVQEIFERTFSITAVLRGVVIVICCAGFLTSILQHCLERARELKFLVMLGVSRVQLAIAFFLEGALLLIPGLALGTVAGLILAWLLVSVINPASFGWSLTFTLSMRDLVPPFLLLLFSNCIASAATTLFLPRILKREPLYEE